MCTITGTWLRPPKLTILPVNYQHATNFGCTFQIRHIPPVPNTWAKPLYDRDLQHRHRTSLGWFRTARSSTIENEDTVGPRDRKLLLRDQGSESVRLSSHRYRQFIAVIHDPCHAYAGSGNRQTSELQKDSPSASFAIPPYSFFHSIGLTPSILFFQMSALMFS